MIKRYSGTSHLRVVQGIQMPPEEETREGWSVTFPQFSVACIVGLIIGSVLSSFLTGCSSRKEEVDVAKHKDLEVRPMLDLSSLEVLFIGCIGIYRQTDTTWPITEACATRKDQKPEFDKIPVNEPLIVKLIDAEIWDRLLEEEGEPFCVYTGDQKEEYGGCSVTNISPEMFILDGSKPPHIKVSIDIFFMEDIPELYVIDEK